VPVQTPEAPPEPALLEPALPEPAPLTVTPVQTPTPQVVPPSPPPPSTIPVAAHEEPTQPWWPVALGYGVLATAVGLVAWMIRRGNGART
jgi:drug/metabolite transporter (DMT)-like permease